MGDMDSENCGSMQSSSTGGGGGGGGCGDDQEYDSRGGGAGESISAFFNSMSNLSNIGGGAPLQLYSLSNSNHQVSNYFDQPPTLSQSSSLECPNFMINHNTTSNNNNNNNGTNNNDNNNNQLDMVWPNKFSSIRPSLSTDDANCTEGPFGYSIPNNNHHHQQQNPPRPIPLPLPSPPVTSPLSSTAPTITGSGRNPKKRSRASRRAPTTVLTTDTNNFRQMVQEFTGIPSPPFTAFSTRARFDLFGGLGGLTSSVVPPPTYLLRPFPQKIPPLQQPPYLANNPSLPSHTTNNTSTIDGLGLSATPTSTTASTSINTSGIAAPSSANFHMCDPQQFLSTNPQLSFQSLLEQTSSALTDHQHDSSMSLGCTTVTPLQTSCSVNPAPGNYRGISAITSAAAAAVNGASDNNVGVAKGEGMIDSWICSSD
ncbi:homeobox protein 5-like [Chenopodium quinoa]|uniref:homeobox protein 5-like n=1 Tax=Chenopodium quinoa TaxID=63459 RepID=UPI000B78F76F|nr:homeobox protein 5-like [Chenopodium quinoa]